MLTRVYQDLPVSIKVLIWDASEALTQRLSACECHGMTHTTFLSMLAPRKDSHNVFSRCGCRRRTHTTSLWMLVLRRDSHNVSVDIGATRESRNVSVDIGATRESHNVSLGVGATEKLTQCFSLFGIAEGLTERLSLCWCDEGSHIACLSMLVSRRDSQYVFFLCGCYGSIFATFLSISVYISPFVFIHLATTFAYDIAVFLFRV